MKHCTVFFVASSFLSTVFCAQSQDCSTKSDVKITFFGFPDNDPPSADIAHNCGRGFTAGGRGTYDDPVTFAAAENGPFELCEIVYIPYLKKYGRYEDMCGKCGEDWETNQLIHIDVWTGSVDTDGGDAQIDCEDTLTQESQTIVVHSGKDLPVDSSALFSHGTCNTSHTYSSATISNLCSRQNPTTAKNTTPKSPFKKPTPFSASSSSSPDQSKASKGPGASPKDDCSWSGHCTGASCNWYGECDSSLTCIANRCSLPSRSSDHDTECDWTGHCEGAECNWFGDCSGSLDCLEGVCTNMDDLSK